jgi:hypothetical protein
MCLCEWCVSGGPPTPHTAYNYKGFFFLIQRRVSVQALGGASAHARLVSINPYGPELGGCLLQETQPARGAQFSSLIIVFPLLYIYRNLYTTIIPSVCFEWQCYVT